MEQNQMKKYFYCYNYLQSDFFIKNGIEPLEVGKGKTGDIYIKFARNDKTQEVFKRWIERGKLIKA